jgi:putative phosphoesterase
MTSEQTIINRETRNYEASKIVGLISDTHVPKRAMCVPKRVFEVFSNVDFVIHAGDLVELEVIDELEQIAPVLAVHGNMDNFEVSNALPKLNSLKILDWKIGVIHDPDSLHGPGKIKDIVEENGFNVLVSGHTHASRIKWEAKRLYINPGSPTDPASFLNKPSVGLLKITKETITPQIINL